jgi:tetratricopeptide (TPR) repeat protein
MEQGSYDRALANVDSAITKDSANAEAYMMKARILRQMADSTTPPSEYRSLFERARDAEQMAIKFDPGRRSTVQNQRKLSYLEEYQKGAKAFNKARRSGEKQDYMRAAAFFGAAGALRPDSTGPILNEAYARLNAAQVGQGENSAEEMNKVIPILERYLEKEDEPSKNAYSILTQLYRQNNQPEKAIELANRAIEDLSNRPTHFRISGTRGITYSGSIEVDGSTRNVEGTVPDRVMLSTSEGMVSGSFWKKEGGKRQVQGRLRVGLYKQGTEAAGDQTTSVSDTLKISQDLTGMAPLAELRNQRLNALNKTGQTEQAMEAYRQQIERNPEDATYRYNYGSLLLNADRYEEAAEQLQKAVELDPDDPKKQYNLGAAYLNKGVALQDSLVSMRDSITSKDRNPTEEERKMVKDLDEQRRELFRQAIPPLERARQLSGPNGQYRQNACSALFQAYVQTEQTEKAKEVQKCAGKTPGNTPGDGN